MKVILESKKDYWMLKKSKPHVKDKQSLAAMIADSLAAISGIVSYESNDTSNRRQRGAL